MRLFSNGLPVRDGLYRLPGPTSNSYWYNYNARLLKVNTGFSQVHYTKFRPDNDRCFKKLLSTPVNKRPNLLRVSGLK